MSEKTIFQKIIDREIPAKIEHEDGTCIAIHDIDPQAPTHILVIPKKLIPRIGLAAGDDHSTLGHLLLTAADIGNRIGGAEGYRVVINNGPNGGEAVPHLHLHVLIGRQMQWPPG